MSRPKYEKNKENENTHLIRMTYRSTQEHDLAPHPFAR